MYVFSCVFIHVYICYTYVNTCIFARICVCVDCLIEVDTNCISLLTLMNRTQLRIKGQSACDIMRGVQATAPPKKRHTPATHNTLEPRRRATKKMFQKIEFLQEGGDFCLSQQR